MAVKPEKIKERFKVLFPKINLSQKRLDELSERLAKKPADDADDTAIDAVINDANDFMPFQQIASDDDRIRTLEAKANEKPKKEEPNPADPPKPSNDTPEWAKVLVESNQKLIEEVEQLKSGKITETKKQAAEKLFNGSDILKSLKPEVKANWLNRISVSTETTEEEIKNQIASLETEFTEIIQTIADSGTYASGVPSGTAPTNAVDEKLISDIVDSF